MVEVVGEVEWDLGNNLKCFLLETLKKIYIGDYDSAPEPQVHTGVKSCLYSICFTGN